MNQTRIGPDVFKPRAPPPIKKNYCSSNGQLEFRLAPSDERLCRENYARASMFSKDARAFSHVITDPYVRGTCSRESFTRPSSPNGAWPIAESWNFKKKRFSRNEIFKTGGRDIFLPRYYPVYLTKAKFPLAFFTFFFLFLSFIEERVTKITLNSSLDFGYSHFSVVFFFFFFKNRRVPASLSWNLTSEN